MKATGVVIVAAAAALASGTVVARAQTASRPGVMTEARVWVENRGAEETIPVALQNTARVQLTGRTEVTLAPQSTVATRPLAERWEYRSATVAAGADPASAINGLGSEMWEAVGLMPSPGGGAVILLKRPR